MKTEAEHIAEGIREYVAKLNELLELARIEKISVYVKDQHSTAFTERSEMEVVSITRTEIL